MAMRKEWKASMVSEATWIETIPAHTVYGAMMSASKDYSLYVAKRKKGHVASIPRCKRRTQKTFFILGNRITENGIYTRHIGKMRSHEPLPNKPMDSRIACENGKWYLLTPYKTLRQQSENQGRVVSLDPGVRTFLTYFSPSEIGKIGDGQFARIVRLSKHLDALQSKISKASSKGSLRKAFGRAKKRIQNLIDDLHYQSISYLVNKFDVIICPTSNFTSAVKKLKRKIRSKTVRSLMNFAFARFRDRLKSKCELLGKTFMEVCESYTSKTHNITGEVIQNLGGRKTITSQGITLDRDINGSLGIFLKGLVAHPAKAAFVN